MDHRRLGRRRRVELPRQEIRALNRRTGLRPRVRRIEDGAAWPGEQHLPAVGRRRRLWRGGRRARGRRRRARDRADQPEGRGAGTVRPSGRADGQCGPERAGDYVEVAGEDTMKPRTLAAAVLALALSAGAAAAQPAKSLKDQIVGTWNFVVAEVTAPDGKKSFPFGETPKGILIFTADGRFAQIHVAGDVPRIASNNRMTATPEEYAAIMRRSLSVFGTYTVDEANRTVTYHIVSSSFPNWGGEAQTRV